MPRERAEGAARAQLLTILEAHDIKVDYAADVVAEARRVAAAPGLDDPDLEDLTDRAFVTIDNPGSRDLDQALHIERSADGYRVLYALADASYYVRPGGALYADAMARGVTYYLPGMAVPMLPRVLSEGVVSLNPQVARRALVVSVGLRADATVHETRLFRARIRSRRQLTYEGVQAFFDGNNDALEGQDFTETLVLLGEVGPKRIELAETRNVVRYNRVEVSAWIDAADPDRFAVAARRRNDVEQWNEQISLLCNAEGARFMAEPGRAPHITPIFRIHPRPFADRAQEFRDLTAAVARRHGLDARVWTWRADEPLADCIARLPADGPQSRVAAALLRQAIMINRRSVFSVEPGRHHGVGAEPYARFSSPMREMVGVFTHKEAMEKLTGAAPSGWPVTARQEQAEMVELANRTKALQKKVAKAADLLILDQFLQADLAQPFDERPHRVGTVLGITAKKIYVQFDEPPFEVKVRISDLSREAGIRLTADDDGAAVIASDAARSSAAFATAADPTLRLGDKIVLRVDRVEQRRYTFRRVHSAAFTSGDPANV